MSAVIIPGTSREIVERMKAQLLRQGDVLYNKYQDGDKFCIFGAVLPEILPDWEYLHYSILDLIRSGEVVIPESDIEPEIWQVLQDYNDHSESVEQLIDLIDYWADVYIDGKLV